MERSVHCPSPVIHGRLTTVVESKKKPLLALVGEVPNIDETEEIDMRTDEADNGDRKGLLCRNNLNLISTAYSSSTKSSINTPVSKPDTRIVQNEGMRKKVLGVQNNLLNMLRFNPMENKPGPTITSEFKEKKEKEVQKNVTNVKANLRNMF